MNGLSNKQVLINRSKYGNNEITKAKQKTIFSLIIEALADPIIKILLIVLAIKLLFLFQQFDWFETIGISVSIILSSTISAISEYASDKAFQSLEAVEEKNSTVIRNNKLEQIKTKDIVVDDLVKITSGESIPADGIIIDGNLSINESSINGETKEKYKKINDEVYSNTIIYDGEAIIKVTKVGDKTLIGSLAKDIQTPKIKSPLKTRLTHLAKIISYFGYAGAFIIFAIYLISSNDYSINNILYALTLSITLIVVAVPEGLPMMITLVLSSNMKKMLKNNIMVRKLVGIETSGNINVLLTDKTGTITQGKLEVENFISPDNNTYNSISKIPDNLRQEVINNITLNNSASLEDENIIGGNQTDQAIIKFSNKSKPNKILSLKEPFNSEKKYSLIITKDNITYLKGAKEALLDNCDYYLNNDGKKKLLLNRNKISKTIDDIAATGSRIIILASSTNKNTLKSLTYIGFLVIKDQVRPTSKTSVDTLHSAGINVIMVTGDAKNTAIAIAKETNIITSNHDIAITHDDFVKLTNEEVLSIYPHLKVIARSLPQDKSRLVDILRTNNYIIGMTGDGINDAGALKKADVGFAMGSGTEVAKEASDIIILDDNIKSITQSVLFGRTIFKSIRKFIIFQITVNLCAMTLAVIGPLINIQTPVTIIQMLWINMIMDTLAGIAFSKEPPLKEYMIEPPKKHTEPIINKYMYQEIFLTGLSTAILCILFLKVPILHTFIRESTDNRYLMTSFFNLFIFTSIFNAMNSRTPRINLFSNISKNIPFIIIFICIIIIQIYLTYFGGNLFRTYGLNLTELLSTIALASIVIPLDLIRKLNQKERFSSI